MFRGKNYIESAKLIDRSKLYDPTEAFDTVIKASKAKFVRNHLAPGSSTLRSLLRSDITSQHSGLESRVLTSSIILDLTQEQPYFQWDLGQGPRGRELSPSQRQDPDQYTSSKGVSRQPRKPASSGMEVGSSPD